MKHLDLKDRYSIQSLSELLGFILILLFLIACQPSCVI